MAEETEAGGSTNGTEGLEHVEQELRDIESTVKMDAASLDRLRKLLEEGYLQSLLDRIENLKGDVADATRAADRYRLEVESLSRRLREEEERLVKLWDAYRIQEREFREVSEKAARLDRELNEKHADVSEAEALLGERNAELKAANARIDDLEDRVAEYDLLKEELNEVQSLKDTITDLTQKYEAEKERLAKLYAVYEEVEAERDRLKRDLEDRDRWFEDNKESFDKLARALRRRSQGPMPKPPQQD